MRVVMLTQADWTNDSRIIREAESLVRSGHEVHVVARRPSSAPRTLEEQNGVTYHVIPHVDLESAADVRALAITDWRVRVAAVSRVLHGPRRIAAARGAGELVGVAAVGAAAMTALAATARWPRLRDRLDERWQRSRGRERLLSIMEPLRYLNDFSYRAGAMIEELEPDVVHAHDLITLSAGVTRGRRVGAKIVYDAHELETHTNYHSLSAVTKEWIRRYEEGLVHRCDAVITVADSIADWLAREYRIKRPAVVMNAPSTTRVKNGGADVRSHLGLSSSTPLMLYVGSVTVDRGLELTVEALRELPDVHFATVGWRYSATEDAMRSTAAAAGVSERLHLIDPVPSDEVISFIRTASVSVIPIQNVCLSYYFCFPNKLLESVLAGLPVAVADLAELRRFVEGHSVGVVMDERDPRAIASAVQTVLDGRDELAPDSRTIDEIEQEYGWPTQERRLAAVYEALERKPRSLRKRRPHASLTPSHTD